MSRTLRKTATVTLVITAKSDTDDNKPIPSPPHEGAQPTRVYQDNYTDAELATILENMITEWATASFPRPCGKAHSELSSVSVVVA